eukprot:CAMPEP_0180286636 /NCGR_PEP_ID=MMETSP0988-20121125/12756_1 /TAXON_ID=697907 /ORGANISM="non described non described, Strain CCMP2293" /LENGTH=51 /DNA_ID=CAMNT_0022260531 /DNA_START=227 /DNA_END=378 /DNA_ORIENTATION=-
MNCASPSADLPRTSTSSIDTRTSPASTWPLFPAGPSMASDATVSPSPDAPA